MYSGDYIFLLKRLDKNGKISMNKTDYEALDIGPGDIVSVAFRVVKKYEKPPGNNDIS